MIVNVYQNYAVTEGCDCCSSEIPLDDKNNLRTQLIDNVLRTLIFCDELNIDYDEIFEEAALKFTDYKARKAENQKD